MEAARRSTLTGELLVFCLNNADNNNNNLTGIMPDIIITETQPCPQLIQHYSYTFSCCVIL